MGICDYTCFVQRNGQFLNSYTYEGEVDEESSDVDTYDDYPGGNNQAIVVLVPIKYSIRDILYWSLKEFRSFKTVTLTYSWDDWDFEEISGYRDILTGDYTEWWETTIWHAPEYPKYHLVNFEPNTYRIFVKHDPLKKKYFNRIPASILKEFYFNRNTVYPGYKRLAIEYIVNAGEANLWEFDKEELAPFRVPKKFKKKLEEHLKLPLYKSLRYTFTRPREISVPRIKVLVGDNLTLERKDLLNILCSTKIGGKTKDELLIEVGLKPRRKLNPVNLLNNCIICGSDHDNSYDQYNDTRWPGMYTCLKHRAYNTQEYIDLHQEKINKYCQQSLLDMEWLSKLQIPDFLWAEFIEKGVEYTINLTHKPKEENFILIGSR